MNLDGVILKVGDTVYDLALGTGTVISITLGFGCQVSFLQKYSIGYNELGVGQFPNKTLFAVQPVVVQSFPGVKHTLFLRVVTATRQAIAELP